MPVVEDKGVWARVIAGSAFGLTAPVETVSDWLYAEVVLEAGAQVPLDADHEERAIYVAEGEVEIAGDSFEAPRLLVFRPGDRITVAAKRRARLMFLGGSRDGRALATSGGTSSRRARSASRRRRKIGRWAGFERCRAKRSSSRSPSGDTAIAHPPA